MSTRVDAKSSGRLKIAKTWADGARVRWDQVSDRRTSWFMPQFLIKAPRIDIESGSGNRRTTSFESSNFPTSRIRLSGLSSPTFSVSHFFTSIFNLFFRWIFLFGLYVCHRASEEDDDEEEEEGKKRNLASQNKSEKKICLLISVWCRAKAGRKHRDETHQGWLLDLWQHLSSKSSHTT